MSNAHKQTQLPELYPTPLSARIGVIVGTVVLAGYVVALVAAAANLI